MARCRRRLLWMIRRPVRRHRRSRELSASGKMRYKRKKAKPEILKHGGNGGKAEDFGGCHDERTFSCDCESRVGFATYPLKIFRFLRFSSVSSVFQDFWFCFWFCFLRFFRRLFSQSRTNKGT